MPREEAAAASTVPAQRARPRPDASLASFSTNGQVAIVLQMVYAWTGAHHCFSEYGRTRDSSNPAPTVGRHILFINLNNEPYPQFNKKIK